MSIYVYLILLNLLKCFELLIIRGNSIRFWRKKQTFVKQSMKFLICRLLITRQGAKARNQFVEGTNSTVKL